jgi:hypothetical protein
MIGVAQNLASIRRRIDAACERSGRPPEGVRLVGVTKTVPVERIREGVRAGIDILGENYVQEARDKIEALEDLNPSWHFIGHLQSNKAKQALRLFHWVHTVDRESLARELDKQARKLERRVPVLIQVNVGEEESKSGVAAERLPELFRAVIEKDALELRGLMTLPPFELEPEEVRPHFRELARLLEELRQAAPRPELLTELSMGMTHDFEVAVEEGATLVRIGTALFGARPTP